MGWRAVALMTLLVLASAHHSRADVVEVTGWQVNVREGPSRSAPVIVTLYRGERFALLGRAASWYHVRIASSGRVGYVHASLVRVIPGVNVPEAEGARPVTRTVPAAPTTAAPAPTTPTPASPTPTLQSVPVAPATATRPTDSTPSQVAAPPAGETAQVVPDEAPQAREGFWIGFGAGYGSASVSTDEFPAEEREGSFTGFLKLGGTLNPQVLLGVESNAWVKSQDDIRLTLGSVTGTVTFYPKVTSGLFLKGGVGASYMSTQVFVDDTTVTVSKTGWGLLAGLGYDVRVGRKVSITPSFNFHFGQPGDIRIDGELALPGWSQNVFEFAVGVTFH